MTFYDLQCQFEEQVKLFKNTIRKLNNVPFLTDRFFCFVAGKKEFLAAWNLRKYVRNSNCELCARVCEVLVCFVTCPPCDYQFNVNYHKVVIQFCAKTWTAYTLHVCWYDS